MARTFKRTYTDKQTGKRRKTPNWYVEFKDHHGLQRRIPGTLDKAATEAIGRKVDKLVALRVAHEEPTGDLALWVESLPPAMIERLVKYDLIDSRRIAAGKPLKDHVADYEKYLRDIKRRNPQHVETQKKRIEAIIKAARASYWSDLTGRIASALTKAQTERGFTDTTYNAYLTAMKAFCNWMIGDGRASTSPAHTVKRRDVEQTEYRRAMTEEEAKELIAYTASAADQSGVDKKGRVKWVMSGPDRALLFLLAIQTGFRAGAIRRLRVRDFKLGVEKPTVTLKGKAATKNKKDMTQPLQPRTAAALKAAFARKLPDARAFDMPDKWDTATMLRRDLDGARQKWLEAAKTPNERRERAESDFLAAEDSEGRKLDFHALRTTTGTLLALQDAPRAITTRIMGHSDYRITDTYYTRVKDDQRRTVVDMLPDLAPEAEVFKATGTDSVDRPVDRFECGTMPTDTDKSGQNGGNALHQKDLKNKAQNDDNPAKSGVAGNTRGKIRTCNLLIRSQVLYPIELRTHPIERSILTILRIKANRAFTRRGRAHSSTGGASMSG